MNLQRFADDEIAGLLSKGTVLSYKEDGKDVPIAAVKSIPALGTDPEKVEVTHLGSEKKSYILGIQDTDSLEFAIVYQGKNFADVHTLVKAGKSKDWTITFPDGLKSEFKGEPSYKFDGVEVNQALGFNLVIVVSEGPDFTPAP
ncbi:phage tail protein [Vagococcus hydrophili]|uniref:Phage tail protein n=1 Tax=Vagococcus hydrophili TaxID=2714947 RepID=A0A6G8AXJ7_9ENTE|nr:phage tail protein [Vagococcus hydrophili]QIL49700.1 phage tail protein [Vagococcus hydrophili]